MTRQEKIKAAEERIKELETLIKHLKLKKGPDVPKINKSTVNRVSSL